MVTDACFKLGGSVVETSQIEKVDVGSTWLSQPGTVSLTSIRKVFQSTDHDLVRGYPFTSLNLATGMYGQLMWDDLDSILPMSGYGNSQCDYVHYPGT